VDDLINSGAPTKRAGKPKSQAAGVIGTTAAPLGLFITWVNNGVHRATKKTEARERAQAWFKAR
jgi:hypothetical protein